MEQRSQANSEQLSDELESPLCALPKRWILWIPLLGLVQFLGTIAIFIAEIAPYAGH